MNFEYGVSYYNGWDSRTYPMAESIEFLGFEEKQQLIEYINCLCVANRGKSFVLRDVFPCKIRVYGHNFFGTKYVPCGTRAISNGDQLRKWQLWKTCLADIKTMPEGITVSMEEKVVERDPIKSRQKNRKIEDVIHMNVTFRVSEAYSSRINSEVKRYSAHRDVMEQIFQDLQLNVLERPGRHNWLEIARSGVALYKLVLFQDLGMAPLETRFQRFAFAHALAEYIENNIAHSKLIFSMHLYLDTCSFSATGEPGSVTVSVESKQSEESGRLRSW